MPSAVEVRLMEEIQIYRCLYDKNVPSFKNGKREKKNAWAAVAATMNLAVEECQRIYNARRTAFVRHLKKVRASQRSGVGRDDILPIGSEWEHMRWLLTHITHRKTQESSAPVAEDECMRMLSESQIDVLVQSATEDVDDGGFYFMAEANVEHEDTTDNKQEDDEDKDDDSSTEAKSVNVSANSGDEESENGDEEVGGPQDEDVEILQDEHIGRTQEQEVERTQDKDVGGMQDKVKGALKKRTIDVPNPSVKKAWTKKAKLQKGTTTEQPNVTEQQKNEVDKELLKIIKGSQDDEAENFARMVATKMKKVKDEDKGEIELKVLMVFNDYNRNK